MVDAFVDIDSLTIGRSCVYRNYFAKKSFVMVMATLFSCAKRNDHVLP